MTTPFPDPRTLLRRHGLNAKKSWGQNFLISERVYRAIVDAVVRADDDWVVELGAGLGTLTARLAQRLPEGKVFAVERDRDMVKVLQAELGQLEDIEIVEGNALTYDLETVTRWRGAPVAVCGNLPYHIAAQIIFRLLAQRRQVTRAVLMIQREMADRLVASPGTRAYSAFGVLVSTYADVRRLLKVGSEAFIPAPKVESAVVEIVPLSRPRVDVVDEEAFSTVVHAGFGQRRKTLRNALKSKFDVPDIDAALSETGIDGGRRGETLTAAEFAALAATLPVS